MTNPIVHSFVLSKSVSSLGTILKIYVEHCVVSNFNFTINENFHFLQKIPGKISNERSWGKGGRVSNLHSLKAVFDLIIMDPYLLEPEKRLKLKGSLLFMIHIFIRMRHSILIM